MGVHGKRLSFRTRADIFLSQSDPGYNLEYTAQDMYNSSFNKKADEYHSLNISSELHNQYVTLIDATGFVFLYKFEQYIMI